MPPQRKTKPLGPDLAALAQAIELYMSESRLTQQAVADDSGLTPKQVGELVRGQRNARYLSLLKLSRGLHIRLGELMTRADELRARDRGR